MWRWTLGECGLAAQSGWDVVRWACATLTAPCVATARTHIAVTFERLGSGARGTGHVAVTFKRHARSSVDLVSGKNACAFRNGRSGRHFATNGVCGLTRRPFVGGIDGQAAPRSIRWGRVHHTCTALAGAWRRRGGSLAFAATPSLRLSHHVSVTFSRAPSRLSSVAVQSLSSDRPVRYHPLLLYSPCPTTIR